ncbi:MAG: aldehyde dehydrogenase [Acidobacteria bacterium]|nr:aldehyde dehydrogenase [Acidobacteriota bacterium]
MNSSHQAALQSLLDAERSKPWADETIGTAARLLAETAEHFLLNGDLLACETAERMGVTPGEVWLETIFPSVWGLLSTRRGLLANAKAYDPLRRSKHFSARFSRTEVAGRQAIKVLPANALELLLLPGFSGHVLLKPSSIDAVKPTDSSAPESADSGLALCLLPFNLASIGVLDIAHLLCKQQQRVVAKVSEKVEFVGPLLERILAPFIEANALRLVYGGPDAGAWLAARPEFSHIHLTGSARTAAAVALVAGHKKLTAELGGVTLAIVFPDALSTESDRRQVARQVAFGALANNGQHCVSFQVVLVPASEQVAFERLLSHEFRLAVSRGGGRAGGRKLVDAGAARRLEVWTVDLAAEGARLTPEQPRADSEYFPVCIIQEIDEKMRIFNEEAFGPVAGLLPLPVEGFAARALVVANSALLSGDLGISLFTSRPHSPEIQRMAQELRHGIVTINTYPGVAFATSLPWGAGPARMSGSGWVHNYAFLPESEIEKVVLTAPLGRKGFGPIRWEDPWLLNVSGEITVEFAKALVQVTLAYFLKQPLRLAKAQLVLIRALRRRESASRKTSQLKA